MEPVGVKDMALEYLHSQLRKRTVDSDSDGAFTPPMPSPRLHPPPSPPQRPRGMAPTVQTPVQSSRRGSNNGFSFNEFRSQSADPKDLKGLRRPDLSGLVGALDAELRKERKFPGQGAMPPRLGFGSLPGSARLPPGSMPMGNHPAGPGSARLPVGGASGNASPAGVPTLSLPPGSPPRPPASPRGLHHSNESLVPSYSMLHDAVSPRSRNGSKQAPDGPRSPSPSYMPPMSNNPMAFVWNQPLVNSPRNSPGPPQALRGRLPEASPMRNVSGSGPVRAVSGSSVDLEGVQARTNSMFGTPRPDPRLSSVAEKAREATGGGMPGPPRARSPGSSYTAPGSYVPGRLFSPGPLRSPRATSPTRQPGPAREQNAARQRSASPPLALRAVRASAPRPGALPITPLASAVPRWSEAPPTASQFPRAGSPLMPRPGSPIMSPRSISPLPITTTLITSGTVPVGTDTGTVWSWKMTMAPSEGGSLMAPLGGSLMAPLGGSTAVPPGPVAHAVGASTAPAVYGATTTSTVTAPAPGPWAGGSLTAPVGRITTPALGAASVNTSPDTLAQAVSALPISMSGPPSHQGSVRLPSTSPSHVPAAVNAPTMAPGPTPVATPSSVPTAMPTPTMPTPYASTQTIATSTTVAGAAPPQAESRKSSKTSPTTNMAPVQSSSASVSLSGSATVNPVPVPQAAQPPPVMMSGAMFGPPRASSGQPYPVAHASASGTSVAPMASTSASGMDWAPKITPPSPSTGPMQVSATAPSVNPPAASASPSAPPSAASSTVAQPGAPKMPASEPIGT